MAYLSSKTSEELKKEIPGEARKFLEVQRDFLSQHLGNWVPLLTEDMLKLSWRKCCKAVAKNYQRVYGGRLGNSRGNAKLFLVCVES